MVQSYRYLPRVATLKLDEERCSGCRMCTTVCPHAVWQVSGGKASMIDRDACMECSACAMNCPEDAISVRRGVGCAAAVVTAALGVKQETCC